MGLMSCRRGGRALALVAALAPLAAAGCSSGGSGIGTATVGYGTVRQVVDAPANVVPRAQVTLTAPDAGTISTLKVSDGQRVSAGQVLAVIDSPDAEQNLRQAQQAYQQAQSGGQVQVPASDLSDTQSSADQAARQAFGQATALAQHVSDAAVRNAVLAQVNAANAAYTAASAAAEQAIQQFDAGVSSLGDALNSLTTERLTQAQVALRLAQQAVAALTITAPIAGTVALGDGNASAAAGGNLANLENQLATAAAGAASGGAASGGSLPGLGSGGGNSSDTVIAAGTPVAAGGDLLTITDASQLTLSATVDETDVLLVTPGVTADVSLNAVPGASYRATVSSVDTQPTTSSTGGVGYRVLLRLAGGTLAGGGAAPVPRPGMSAVAALNVRTVPHTLAVPSSALMENGSQYTVWLVTGGHARRQVIRLGAQGDVTVQVTGGLRAGDQIVVSGADKVHAGQRI
jgi:HlyD family secretion protein